VLRISPANNIKTLEGNEHYTDMGMLLAGHITYRVIIEEVIELKTPLLERPA